MSDDQQPAVEAATGDNVMGKVLGTFDGLVDNATAAVGGAASAVKDAGAGLVETGSEVTGTLGEKATGAISGVRAVISENFDAAVTFAKGLIGGLTDSLASCCSLMRRTFCRDLSPERDIDARHPYLLFIVFNLSLIHI